MTDFFDGPVFPGASCGSVMLGTVAANYDDNDKEAKGLISVKLPMLEDKRDIIKRVRVMQPYATGGNGFYFLPEVGDVVVVAFPGQDIERGIVLGSLYPAKKEGRLLDKKNEKKEISTRSGLALTFADTEKKESLTLKTPKGQTVSLLDENEQLIVQAKDGVMLTLDGKNGQITLQTSESLTLKCGSASVVLKKNGDIQLNGKDIGADGQNVAVQAKAQLTLNGQTVHVKSKTTTTVEGGTKLDIKASGVTDVKGLTVKLNG